MSRYRGVRDVLGRVLEGRDVERVDVGMYFVLSRLISDILLESLKKHVVWHFDILCFLFFEIIDLVHNKKIEDAPLMLFLPRKAQFFDSLDRTKKYPVQKAARNIITLTQPNLTFRFDHIHNPPLRHQDHGNSAWIYSPPILPSAGAHERRKCKNPPPLSLGLEFDALLLPKPHSHTTYLP